MYHRIRIFIALVFFASDSFATAVAGDEALAFATFIQSIIQSTQGVRGVTCTYGSDEISKTLLSKEKRVINLNTDINKYTSCRAIYIARGREKGLRVDIDKFNKKKILTIGAFDSFSEIGGMVQVQMGRRNFELILNSKLLKDSGIRLSPLATELVIN